MLSFDRKKFFEGFRPEYHRLSGKNLNQLQVSALTAVFDQVETDSHWTVVEFFAYALATMAIETAYTWLPIDEMGSAGYFEGRYGWHTKVGRGLGNGAPGEGAKFHGRGDVQVTGESNYEKAETLLRQQYPDLVVDFERRTGEHFDLTDSPDQAKDPQIAFAIMTLGMHQGWFTGKKFANFSVNDFYNMRTIINGHDHADLIAKWAVAFLGCLKPAQMTTGTVKIDVIRNMTGAAGLPTVSDVPPAPPTQVADTIVNAAPVAPAPPVVPDGPPAQVSNPVAARAWAGGGILMSILGGIWAAITAHPNTVLICTVGAIVLVVIILFRGAILDALRMYIASRQDLKNVK